MYDAEGRRVRKISSSGTVDFLYDLSGHVIAEVSSTGNWNRGEVYAGGMHLATYDNGTTYFNHADWLGTERARSKTDGTIYSTWISYPFGEGSQSGNPGPTHFTGKERDTESGLDYFGARYYGSSMGRMMSPDPFLPFNLKKEQFQSWISNPQHWNKYAYVLNNPLKFTDPTGMTETVYYYTGGLNDQQKKFFNDHKDAILSAIGNKLKEAGIKDVVFKDGNSLSKSQVNAITQNAPKGVTLLNFVNNSYNSFHPDAGTYGGTSAGSDQSVVAMGHLQAGNPDANTLIFRMGEVGAHEIGHNMGFFSRNATMSFIEFWNRDLMNEGQGMPHSPEHFDMSIPQNRQAVDEINKLPEYSPH